MAFNDLQNLWKFTADMEINGTVLKILKDYYTDMLHKPKLIMNYQIQLKLQKALDKVTVILQFYLIFTWKKLWIIRRRVAKEWECLSNKISACFLLTMLIKL